MTSLLIPQSQEDQLESIKRQKRLLRKRKSYKAKRRRNELVKNILYPIDCFILILLNILTIETILRLSVIVRY